MALRCRERAPSTSSKVPLTACLAEKKRDEVFCAKWARTWSIENLSKIVEAECGSSEVIPQRGRNRGVKQTVRFVRTPNRRKVDGHFTSHPATRF